jgi:hypothetical protein
MADLMVLIRQGELPDEAWPEDGLIPVGGADGPISVGGAHHLASMAGGGRRYPCVLLGERARPML